MNLKSFGIANFKAFGATLPMPIKPLTLVFGPNSAGKSSLLHSFLWLNHVLQTGECDVTSPQASQGEVDLGGFAQIRHRHQKSGVIYNLSFSGGKIAQSFEIELTYEAIEKDGQKPQYGLKESGLILDGKNLLKTKGSLVTELDFTHSLFSDCLGRLSESHGKDARSILGILCFMVGEEDFGIKILNGLPSELNCDFFRQIVARKDASQQTFDQSITFFFEVISPIFREIFKEINKAVGRVVGDLIYLPPVRKLPPRNFDPSKQKESAWKEISKRPELINEVNRWLGGERMLGTQYRLENRAFLPLESIQKKSPVLLKRELWGLLTNTNFAADAAFLMEEAQAEFKKLDKKRYVDEHPDLWQYLFDNEMGCLEDSEDWEDLTPEERVEHARDVVDSRIHDGDADDQLWDHYLENFQPLTDYLEEKWSIEDATKRLASGIENECLDRKHEFSLVQSGSETRLALQDVGFGISQFLPVLIHSYASKNQLIAIEQPEIHIHPRLQAELGDVFIESALGENKNTFLLETHSEHLILRILRRIRETTEGNFSDWPEALREACPNGIRPQDVAVLFVKPGAEGSEVIELPVDANGEFTCDWPGGFFEERLKEFF